MRLTGLPEEFGRPEFQDAYAAKLAGVCDIENRRSPMRGHYTSNVEHEDADLTSISIKVLLKLTDEWQTSAMIAESLGITTARAARALGTVKVNGGAKMIQVANKRRSQWVRGAQWNTLARKYRIAGCPS